MGIVFWLCAVTSLYHGAQTADNIIVKIVLFVLWIGAMACAYLNENRLEKRIEKLERKDGDGE